MFIVGLVVLAIILYKIYTQLKKYQHAIYSIYTTLLNIEFYIKTNNISQAKEELHKLKMATSKLYWLKENIDKNLE